MKALWFWSYVKDFFPYRKIQFLKFDDENPYSLIGLFIKLSLLFLFITFFSLRGISWTQN